MSSRKNVQNLLEDLCIARLKDSWHNDSFAAHLAGALLEVTALGEAFYSSEKSEPTQSRAYAALHLLGRIEKLQETSEKPYPVTKTILWEALCIGWLNSDNSIAEHAFARGLISTQWMYEEGKGAMKYLRERFESYTAAGRLKRLIVVNAEGDDNEVVRIVAHKLINQLDVKELAALAAR